MIGLINIPTLFLSLLMIPVCIGAPPVPVVDPLLCALCGTTPFPFPCLSRGLAYAVQVHPFRRADSDYTFSTVDFTFFYTAAPYQPTILGVPPPFPLLSQTGFTRRIGWVASPGVLLTSTIYDGLVPLDIVGLAINHRSYFVPPTTGSYIFTATDFDDGLFMWLGEDAFDNKYTRENAKLFAVLGMDTVKYTVDLEAGVYYPFRVLFINGYGSAIFRFSITAPDGSVLFNARDAINTQFFVPYSCDNASPAFRAFGKETGA